MKHDELCPARGRIFISSCQCKLIAKVRTDQQLRVSKAIDDAVDGYLEEYARGMAEGYRLGRESAANDLVTLLDQYNLPQVANIEFVIRNGMPR